MTAPHTSTDPVPGHVRIDRPSGWVRRFAPLVPAGGLVLDLACGGGRHARFFRGRGHPVVAVDRDTRYVGALAGDPATEVITFDLEAGAPWPLPGRTFAAVVVVNYLYRPLFDDLLGAVAPGGVLLYDTFARGNERFNRPRNPDHLLRAGELLDRVAGRLTIIGYEHGIVAGDPCPGVKQRLCAVNAPAAADRADGEPEPVTLPEPGDDGT